MFEPQRMSRPIFRTRASHACRAWLHSAAGLTATNPAALVRPALAVGVLNAGLVLVALTAHAVAAADPSTKPTAYDTGASAPTGDPQPLEVLIDQLDNPRYALRESATREIIRRGAANIDLLEQRLRTTDRAETRRRLRLILEHVAPPKYGVLVLAADEGIDLQPGDLITHADGRTVHNVLEFTELLDVRRDRILVRVASPTGGRELEIPASPERLAVASYDLPLGNLLREAVQTFAAGRAEQAYDLFTRTPQLAERAGPAFAARIAYASGAADAALTYLASVPAAIETVLLDTSRSVWDAPSRLTLAAPGTAPYELEFELWTQRLPEEVDVYGVDPDPRVQRVFVPARRFDAALVRSAELWQDVFRGALFAERMDRDLIRPAGNLLAVISWMCSEQSLLSECIRLVEPRSAMLDGSALGVWVRVQTDSWLALLEGAPRTAVQRFWAPALRILSPPAGRANRSVIQNPVVAAQLGLFVHSDTDVEAMAIFRDQLTEVDGPARDAALDWTSYAATRENLREVRATTRALVSTYESVLPNLALTHAALIEYVSPDPDVASLLQHVDATRPERPPADPAWSRPRRAPIEGLLPILVHLAANDLDAAARQLADAPPGAGARTLSDTIEFRRTLARVPDAPPHLARALVAVAAGKPGHWFAVGADRSLYRVTPEGATRFNPRPQRNVADIAWFPTPQSFPWLARDPESGQVWVYDRRRATAVTSSGDVLAAINVPRTAIHLFDALLPFFGSALLEALTDESGEKSDDSDSRALPEDGSFRRAEIQAFASLVDDPDLPSVGWIDQVPGTEQVVHLALRGGPQFVYDATRDRIWSTRDAARALELTDPPRIVPRLLPGRPDDPRLVLYSTAGVILLNRDTDRFERLALPTDNPHPPVVPEILPYERSDPRFIYVAEQPGAEVGAAGRVFRWVLADRHWEPLPHRVIAYPREFYALQRRSVLRERIETRLRDLGLPELEAMIEDARVVVSDWRAARNRR